MEAPRQPGEESLLAEVHLAMKQLGVTPQRRRSQNFMVDPKELAWIAEAVAPAPQETLVEIGPGLGFLTRELLGRGAYVIAVEKDFRLARRLARQFPPSHLKIVEKDILETRLADDLGLSLPAQVVGNIPYHITSPILEWVLSQRKLVRRAFLTLQWEVAERICAPPGGKTWGPLSIYVQYHAAPSILRKIHRRSFYPAPQVDSAVICLDLSAPKEHGVRDEERFFSLLRRAFQKRRKTLLNALTDPSDPACQRVDLHRVLLELGWDPNRRPETLSIEEWSRLSNKL